MFCLQYCRSFTEEAFPFISVLGVLVPICNNHKRRNEEQGFFCGAPIIGKTIWNLSPVIDQISRAITESGGSFLLVLDPAFSKKNALVGYFRKTENAIGGAQLQ